MVIGLGRVMGVACVQVGGRLGKSTDLDKEEVCFLLLALHHHHIVPELQLHLGHLRRRGAQLDQPRLEPALEPLDVRLVLFQQRFVHLDQLEVRFGSRVHLPPLDRGELLAGELHRLVHERHVVRHVLTQLVARHAHLCQEALRNRDERLTGPRVEPVDDRAVDDRGELARARAEGVAHGRHAHDHVQVGPHFVYKVVPAVVSRVEQPSGLHLGPNSIDDIVFVIVGVELGDVAAREQVVEVDEHPLVDDLLVGEEEDDRVALETRARVERVHVALEVGHRVRLRQFHLRGGSGEGW